MHRIPHTTNFNNGNDRQLLFVEGVERRRGMAEPGLALAVPDNKTSKVVAAKKTKVSLDEEDFQEVSWLRS